MRLLDGTVEAAWRAFGKVDVLHDNGIWRLHHLALMRLAERHGAIRVVSPRGMLTPWALDYKPVRKRVAWLAYQRRSLNRASALHATAESEADDLRRLGISPPIEILPNGVSLPDWSRIKRARQTGAGVRTCLFMSRLNPKKGIPMLLDAWALLRPEGWRLDIAGPNEDGYQAELEKRVEKLELGEDVRFLGSIEGQAKLTALARADFLVLPTHSENFGIVVAEALAHGCPVITTHGAPWEILETERCGWWVPISVDAITEAMREAMHLAPEARQAMGQRGRSCVDREYSWADIARRSVDLYQATAR